MKGVCPKNYTSGCKRGMGAVNDGVDWYKLKKCFDESVFFVDGDPGTSIAFCSI